MGNSEKRAQHGNYRQFYPGIGNNSVLRMPFRSTSSTGAVGTHLDPAALSAGDCRCHTMQIRV
ncbi:MAG: hypothetical protein ACOY9J_02040 [Pseudomonadota bacterium]